MKPGAQPSRGALPSMARNDSSTQQRINLTERIVRDLDGIALTPDQAERIAVKALQQARVNGHPSNVTAERIGVLIDFARIDRKQAKLLASRLLRRALILDPPPKTGGTDDPADA